MKLTVSYRKPEIVLRVDGADARDAGMHLYDSMMADQLGVTYNWSFEAGVFRLAVRPSELLSFDAAVLQPWLEAWIAKWPDAQVEFPSE